MSSPKCSSEIWITPGDEGCGRDVPEAILNYL